MHTLVIASRCDCSESLPMFVFCNRHFFPSSIWDPDCVFILGVHLLLNILCSKLPSLVVSLFSSVYVTKWKEFFPEKELKYPPSYRSRVISCASIEVLQAYLAWRQNDCKYSTAGVKYHLNNFEHFWNEFLVWIWF